MKNIRELFLEDLAKNLDYWINEGASSISNETADLMWTENPEAFGRICKLIHKHNHEDDIKKVLSEILRGFAVSFLTIIDGGTELAETTRIGIFDENNNHLGELHDEFVSHLIKTDRIE